MLAKITVAESQSGSIFYSLYMHQFPILSSILHYILSIKLCFLSWKITNLWFANLLRGSIIIRQSLFITGKNNILLWPQLFKLFTKLLCCYTELCKQSRKMVPVSCKYTGLYNISLSMYHFIIPACHVWPCWAKP